MMWSSQDDDSYDTQPPAMAPVDQVGAFDMILLLAGIWLASKVVSLIRCHSRETRLKGPASKSWFFGVGRYLADLQDRPLQYEQWGEEFGVAYRIPAAVRGQKIIILDPKGISHFYSKETFGYVQNTLSRTFVDLFVSKKSALNLLYPWLDYE